MTQASTAAAPAAAGTIPGRWQLKYLALSLIWGSSFLFMKLGLVALHPVQVSTMRVVVGALVVAITAVVLRVRLPRDASTWLHLSVTGFFLCTLPFTLFALGETRISSGLAGIGNAATPIATVVMALVLLPSDRPTTRKLLGVVLGLAGVVVIAQPWTESGRPDLIGFGMTVIAGCSYGVGWTYNRRFLGARDLGGLAQPTAQLLAAVPQMLVALLIWSAIEGFSPIELRGTSAEIWLALACVAMLGALGTGLAYVLQFDVVRAAGPTVSSTVTYLIPVVSVGLGFLLLHERLGIWQLVGAVIVIAAGAIVQSRGRVTTKPV